MTDAPPPDQAADDGSAVGYALLMADVESAVAAAADQISVLGRIVGQGFAALRAAPEAGFAGPADAPGSVQPSSDAPEVASAQGSDPPLPDRCTPSQIISITPAQPPPGAAAANPAPTAPAAAAPAAPGVRDVPRPAASAVAVPIQIQGPPIQDRIEQPQPADPVAPIAGVEPGRAPRPASAEGEPPAGWHAAVAATAASQELAAAPPIAAPGAGSELANGRPVAPVATSLPPPLAPAASPPVQPWAAPRSAADAGQPAPATGPTRGDVFLDGERVGYWLADTLARGVGGPARGTASFDPRLGPRWPGALQGH